jgi:hypothetical protein
MAARATRLFLLSLLAGLALSACGSSSSSDGSGKSYDSVSTLAQDLGCSGAALNEGVSGVKEEGQCRLDGEQVTVAIWPDGVDPKEPPGASSPFGGTWVVLGKNWTVATVTAGGAKKVQEKLGGTLQ